MESKGTNFIHSTPGNPQQNGCAERLNQTLNNCATTLLNSAKLPLNLWDSIILCVAYLYNINPHQSIDNKIPNELFFLKFLVVKPFFIIIINPTNLKIIPNLEFSLVMHVILLVNRFQMFLLILLLLPETYIFQKTYY